MLPKLGSGGGGWMGVENIELGLLSLPETEGVLVALRQSVRCAAPCSIHSFLDSHGQACAEFPESEALWRLEGRKGEC